MKYSFIYSFILCISSINKIYTEPRGREDYFFIGKKEKGELHKRSDLLAGP